MPDLDELLARYELGLADAAEQAELAALLRIDPSARRELVRQARASAILARTLAGSPLRIHHRPLQRRCTSARPGPATLRWAIAAGLLLAVGAAVAVAISRGSPDPTDIADRPVVPVPGMEEGWRIVTLSAAGTIAGTTGSRPACPGDGLAVGDTVDAGGALTISGPANLELMAGTRLHLTTPHHLELSAGRIQVVARHRDSGSPLLFATPQATATIIGTRFGLAVVDGTSHLEVSEGAVRFADARGGVLVRAGESALADAGLVTMAPGSWKPMPALPAGSRTLWRADPGAGWYGLRQVLASGTLWCSRPSDNGENREVRALVRSPMSSTGWVAGANCRLRFASFATGFAPGSSLRVMLKRQDQTNFAKDLPVENGVWTTVTLRPCDGSFTYLRERGRHLEAGEQVVAAAWVGLSDVPMMQARFWIRDVVVFTEDE